MDEQLLMKMKKEKVQLVIKPNGEVCIEVGSQQTVVEQIETVDNANLFAAALQLIIEHFIGYQPEIKELLAAQV